MDKLALSQNDFSDVLSNPAVSFHIDIDPNNIEQILYEDRTNLAIHSYTLISLKSLVELDKDYYQLLNTLKYWLKNENDYMINVLNEKYLKPYVDKYCDKNSVKRFINYIDTK